jgi:hypothetical protein
MKYIHVFVDAQRIGLLRKFTRPNGASGLGIHVLFVTVRFECPGPLARPRYFTAASF